MKPSFPARTAEVGGRALASDRRESVLVLSGATLVDDARASLAARLILDLQRRPDLAARVSQIDVTDVHDAIVVFKDDTALVHLGADKFVERVQSYIDLTPALRERIPEIDYVDLRFDERVYVRPSRGRRQRGS